MLCLSFFVRCMPHDRRRRSSKEKENLRLRVVRRTEAGIHPEDLAQDLDINRRTVYRWLEKYHYGGEGALKAEPRPGREPKLNALKMTQVARMIRDRNPLQLNFTFALWNRAMVRELVRRELGVRLSETSVGRVCCGGWGSARNGHCAGATSRIGREWSSGGTRSFPQSSDRPRRRTP